MIRSFLTVGLWTLLSRITGFLRDMLLAGLLGAGGMMDIFAIAQRLPNHFRAIFAEGAFNTAFVPAYTRIRTAAGTAAADLFLGRILSLLLASQLLFLALVLMFTPQFVALLAPGFTEKRVAFDLAVELTRITFPYLGLMSLAVLWQGVLNAEKRFHEGAAAPILLNLSMIATLLMSAAFASRAHAAAWGVFIAGFLEAALLGWGAWRAGLIAPPRWPRLDDELRGFFRAFGPAVIGVAGTQIAMLADTVIVTFLPQSSASALYYADRLYQLPLGVIGVAAGTVLLPEMSRLIAAGRPDLAHAQQNRALVLSWLFATPFFIGFMTLPELMVAAIFQRGAFGAEATGATAAVLFAYAIGLLAIVAIRSVVASFHARGDTKTPLYASLFAIGLNLAIKLAIWKSHGAAGLAFATALGAIANFMILFVLAWRGRKSAPDATFAFQIAIIGVGGIWLAAFFLHGFLLLPVLAPLPMLSLYGAIGAALYFGMVFLGFRLAKLPLNLRRSA
ncbi:MAG: murein biosynthesis integral membrane protein MurJ [Proteobacteria bacterium]|nr:murein biosynthesis integral membrane protein MurJ [Pseudomonadota bacterium]